MTFGAGRHASSIVNTSKISHFRVSVQGGFRDLPEVTFGVLLGPPSLHYTLRGEPRCRVGVLFETPVFRRFFEDRLGAPFSRFGAETGAKRRGGLPLSNYL